MRAAHGNDKSPRPADHAVLIIDIEIANIEQRAAGFLQHQRQAVNGDAARHHRVAGDIHQRPLIIGAVARYVDHAPQATNAVALHQVGTEGHGAGDGGAVDAPQRCPADRVGEGAGLAGAADQRPVHHQLLLIRPRPFDIGDGDAAMRAEPQSVEEFRRGDGGDIALALESEFVEVHGVGHVDRQHQFDIDDRVGAGDGRRAHTQTGRDQGGKGTHARHRDLRP